jgi:hypothetical protein
VKDFLAYYYNHAEENGKKVVVTYKDHDIIPGAGVRDLELGQEPEITYNDWITDSSVDDRGAWGYADDLTFKTPDRLIDNLIDRVSKNGYLLLNVGPKADGTIPDGAKKVLLEMGGWLQTNGEAIYNTTPWFIAGEGSTKIGEIERQGFNESDIMYTSKDIRFTVNDNNLFATFLDWPGDIALIKSLRVTGSNNARIDLPEWTKVEAVKSLAGTEWYLDDIEDSNEKNHYVFKEHGDFYVEGGAADDGYTGNYIQIGTDVYLQVGETSWSGTYDGNIFVVNDEEIPHYPGFYEEEIKHITMLGDGEELDWVMTPHGLIIKTPEQTGEYAYVFKIERYHRPKLSK